ncbi:hypothetical protein D3C86_1732100 [compost metagenome]
MRVAEPDEREVFHTIRGSLERRRRRPLQLPCTDRVIVQRARAQPFKLRGKAVYEPVVLQKPVLHIEYRSIGKKRIGSTRFPVFHFASKHLRAGSPLDIRRSGRVAAPSHHHLVRLFGRRC